MEGYPGVPVVQDGRDMVKKVSNIAGNHLEQTPETGA